MLLVIFLTDFQPCCTNLTNSQHAPGWEWPKQNSQLFPKFPYGMGTLHLLLFLNQTLNLIDYFLVYKSEINHRSNSKVFVSVNNGFNRVIV